SQADAPCSLSFMADYTMKCNSTRINLEESAVPGRLSKMLSTTVPKIPSFLCISQGIARAASAGAVFDQKAQLDEAENIPQRGVVRALGQFRPFGRGQFPHEISVQ